MKDKTPMPPTPPQSESKPAPAALPPTISLRNYFAAAALQGAIAHHGIFPRDTMAADCYRIADQMIAASK